MPDETLRDDLRPFRLGPVERALDVRPYAPEPGEPLHRRLEIFTRDPTASRLEGAVGKIEVPYEPLDPGPAGRLFRVEDLDETTGRLVEPLDLDSREMLLHQGLSASTADPRFAQQMAYAVCSQIYDRFRRALGRDPTWGFDRRDEPGRLVIRPHAVKQWNAAYLPTSGRLDFGYQFAKDGASGRNQTGARVFTALSHDIVVHEVSHALLDGLRPAFSYASHPDVPAFHEGFADLVAIFSRFSHRELLELAISRSDGGLTDHLLVDLATQFGQTMDPQKGKALRAALPENEDFDTPMEKLLSYPSSQGTSPHLLGSVLIAAVFEAYRVVYRRKTADLLRIAGIGPLPRARDRRSNDPWQPAHLPEALVRRLAAEASKLAEQFLNICIRAVDYCPPCDLRFGEYLRALVTADADLVPEDPWAYREALVDAFRRRQVEVYGVADLSEESLKWHRPAGDLPHLDDLAFGRRRFDGSPGRAASAAELRRQAEAVGRYVTRPERLGSFGLVAANDPDLDGDRVERPTVDSIRSVQRVGPDGHLAFDMVAEVVQRRFGPSGRPVTVGGATIIFGPKGDIRYVVFKHTGSRQRRADWEAYRKEVRDGGGTPPGENAEPIRSRDRFFSALHPAPREPREPQT